MERDFANDYDEWYRLYGGNDPDTGGTAPVDTPDPLPNTPPPPKATTPPPATNTPPPPTGKTRAEIEAEGRAHDAANGLIGGYMDGDVWVNGSPSSSGGGGGGGGTTYGGDFSGSGSYDTSGFAWPQFAAPTYTPGPAFTAPPAFQFDAFSAPKPSEIYSDPSYTQRRDEGLQAIEHGAAAKGLTRLPQTLKALAGWNQNFASREYGNIFDRAGQTYDRNRNNAADTYSLNYGVSRDVWDRGEQQNVTAFDRNYKSAYDSFDMNEWKPAAMTFEDMRARYLAELDATTRLASGWAE
jgi:hypothetical protein